MAWSLGAMSGIGVVGAANGKLQECHRSMIYLYDWHLLSELQSLEQLVEGTFALVNPLNRSCFLLLGPGFDAFDLVAACNLNDPASSYPCNDGQTESLLT